MKLEKYFYARKTFARLLTVLKAPNVERLETPKRLICKSLGRYASNICHDFNVDKSYCVWSCPPRRSFFSERSVPDQSRTAVSAQEEMIASVVEKDEPLSRDEWTSVRNDVLSAHGPIREQSFDASIMHACCKERRFNVGRSFVEFLQQDKEPNVATVGLLMKLFNLCFWNRDVDPEVTSFVLRLYDSLRQKWPLLDIGTAERAIEGLSLTTRWKEGLELLEMAKLTDWPHTSAYTALACASFNNGENERGWQLLAELFQRENRKPGKEAYLTWLKNGGNIFTLMEFLSEHGDIISVDVAEQLKRNAEGTKMWKGNLSSISDRGICRSCRSLVSSANLTDEEYGKLQSAVLERVLVGDNVYLKTTPTELQSFQNFLRRHQKYNVVLDGLNIAMAAMKSTNRGYNNCQPAMLKDAVYHFVRIGCRVLVLGRKHMGKWSRKYMDYIYKNAQVFLAENMTQDDPLLLLAALNSGLGTRIVSRDLLRGHRFLLREPDLRRLFRRWQYNHQCTYLTIGGRITIIDPPGLVPEAQKSCEDSWHVPYETTSGIGPSPTPLKIPDNWLCLVKREIK